MSTIIILYLNGIIASMPLFMLYYEHEDLCESYEVVIKSSLIMALIWPVCVVLWLLDMLGI